MSISAKTSFNIYDIYIADTTQNLYLTACINLYDNIYFKNYCYYNNAYRYFLFIVWFFSFTISLVFLPRFHQQQEQYLDKISVAIVYTNNFGPYDFYVSLAQTIVECVSFATRVRDQKKDSFNVTLRKFLEQKINKLNIKKYFFICHFICKPV